ncbi:MAG: ECF transporter S component [Desulfatirhabdiaceae bacterium]
MNLTGAMSSTRTLRIAVICVLTGCVYGFANMLSGKYYLPGCSFAEMRPQVALPMFMGVLYGPVSGFVCGGLGDMLGYSIAGKGLFFAVHWSIANGLMGLIPGLAGAVGARPVDSIPSFVRLLVLLLLASCLPFAFSTGIEFWLGRIPLREAVFEFFLPIFITDTLWAFILVPPMMQMARLLIIRIEMRTIQAVYYLLIATVLATWLSIVISMREQITFEELYSLGAVTLVVLVIGLAVSAFLSRRITAPVITLTTVARRVAEGDYTNVTELKDICNRQDELGTMGAVFSDMLSAVARREQDLQKEVTTLRIQIDRSRQSADLEKITGSEYFRMLKQRASNLRREAGSEE